MMVFLCLCAGCRTPSPAAYAGVVYDAATKAPLKGVFVLAHYTESGGVLFGHSSTWCVKSMSARTESDGSYSFPIEKNRFGPTRVAVLLAGYYTKEQLLIDTMDSERAYSGTGHDFYLARQDPANITLRVTSPLDTCDRAANKVDAAASKQFHEMVDAEIVRIQSGRALSP